MKKKIEEIYVRVDLNSATEEEALENVKEILLKNEIKPIEVYASSDFYDNTRVKKSHSAFSVFLRAEKF